MSVLLSYPAWYILLCLLCGAAYASLLYFRAGALRESPLWVRRLLAFGRFVVISILAFLLLEPLIRTENRKTEKPVIVIAQDNSQSLLLAPDSAYYRNQYPAELEKLSNTLAEKFEVKRYTFGSGLRENGILDFSEKQTRISQLFDELFTRYYNRNLGAIVLASDGIINAGSSPLNALKNFKGTPIFTIAMGDTTVRKDLVINDVAHNRLAYSGNSFPVEIQVEAFKAGGLSSRLRILKAGNEVAGQTLSFAQEQVSLVIPFTLEAGKPGLQRYRVELAPLEGELTEANNYYDFYVEVLDSKQKILILAQAPHPDIAALKSAAASQKNYEIKTALAANFNEAIEPYSLVILHQLPARNSNAGELIKRLKAKNIPVLYVLGGQSDIPAFNQLETGISIQQYRGALNPVNALAHTGFTFFTLSEKTLRSLSRFPPIHVPFGEFVSAPSVNSLLRQKVGGMETHLPLIFFNKEKSQKTGVICGEGIWRWRLQSMALHGDHETFNEIITKSIQFLATRENKSLFRVFARNTYTENEAVVLDAELYNESYELINEPETDLKIVNSEGQEYRFVFSKTAQSYRLDAGRLPAGDYTYTASVTSGGKSHQASGQFTVSAIQVEMWQSVANHQLLLNLASNSGGEMVYPSDLQNLAQLISTRENIVEVTYTQTGLSDLLHFKWIFFLLLLLLTLEWSVRKWAGAY